MYNIYKYLHTSGKVKTLLLMEDMLSSIEITVLLHQWKSQDIPFYCL